MRLLIGTGIARRHEWLGANLLPMHAANPGSATVSARAGSAE